MKFVDEVVIEVIAGKGGNGVASFRREKFIPKGGPNGGDGGEGGSIYLVGSDELNTLVDFRNVRIFKAENGQAGAGSQKTGKSGNDLLIKVPMGTRIVNEETNELIGDVVRNKQKLLVAKGGEHGLGNVHFKSSTNRTPRQFTLGENGESRQLRLELIVLADVGLLGLPNAGKSTFISAVSNARPKIADYPFTTLYPQLGLVELDENRNFVMADIPGLIKDSSQGTGLGISFLKHLERTKLLLHLVDISPENTTSIKSIVKQICEQIKIVSTELENFSQSFLNKPIWIVLNKADLIGSKQKANEIRKQVVKELNLQQPCFVTSSIANTGLKELVNFVGDFICQDKYSKVEEKDFIDDLVS